MKLTIRPLTPDRWPALEELFGKLGADKTWRLTRVDDLPLWSISCLYVRKGCRRKGVTSALKPIRSTATSHRARRGPDTCPPTGGSASRKSHDAIGLVRSYG